MALGGIVRGKRTTLRTPKEEDLAAYNRWMADMRVRRSHRVWHEPAMPATWKDRFTEQTKDRDSVLWSIDVADQLVGLIKIDFGWSERTHGWIDQFVIDPEAWRRGHASDAALALHRYLFDYLDMKRMSVTLRSDNAGALRIAEQLGYTHFGLGHDVFYRDGAYVDEVWLLMERPAWDARWSAEREYAPMRAREGAPV